MQIHVHQRRLGTAGAWPGLVVLPAGPRCARQSCLTNPRLTISPEKCAQVTPSRSVGWILNPARPAAKTLPKAVTVFLPRSCHCVPGPALPRHPAVPFSLGLCHSL